jgi:hypothetical protein
VLLDFDRQRCRYDLVSARDLRLVQAAVRELHEGLSRITRTERAAYADRDADVLTRGGERIRRCGVPNSLGHLDRTLEIGARQHDQELLATPPTRDVAGPQFGAQAVGECAQHQVAGRMTVGVVDVLEVVDVE